MVRPWTRDAPGSTGQEGFISESKRGSPRPERTPTSTKSTGVPRPMVSESSTTKVPSESRERAHRTASSRPPIRPGVAFVRVPPELPILPPSSHAAGAMTTAASSGAGRKDDPVPGAGRPLIKAGRPYGDSPGRITILSPSTYWGLRISTTS